MTEKPYKPSAELAESDLAASSSASNRSLSSYMLQAIDRIQELEAELAGSNEYVISEWENKTKELYAELSGVHAGTHVIVPVKATPEMLAEGWACLKRNHLPKLGPGKCLIEAWPAMIKAAKDPS